MNIKAECGCEFSIHVEIQHEDPEYQVFIENICDSHNRQITTDFIEDINKKLDEERSKF